MVLLIISLLLNITPGLRVIYWANRHKRELEEQKPVLNLAKFEAIYKAGVLHFGKGSTKVIAQICVRTAQILDARMLLETELLQKNGEAEVASKKCTTDIADGAREYGLYIHNLEAEREEHDKRSVKMKELYELIQSPR